jgi:bifunctional non-homologous end joining protein LigD
MKAFPVEKLPEGDWLFEIKHDGYRALAFKDGKEVRLVSRNGKAFDYPLLLEALKKLPAEGVILDGEIAALDEKGRSSFQLLQLFKRSGGVPLVYYVFDLLFLEGKDLCKEPLSARRKLLANVLKKAPENVRLSEELRGSKEELLRVAQEFGLEGLVAKRKSSVYERGRRSGAWSNSGRHPPGLRHQYPDPGAYAAIPIQRARRKGRWLQCAHRAAPRNTDARGVPKARSWINARRS